LLQKFKKLESRVEDLEKWGAFKKHCNKSK
jgi:hypothetical protein